MDVSENVRKWWVLVGCSFALLMATMDFTVVNTSLSVFQTAFQARTDALQWILGAWGIAFATFLSIGGRLGDRHGHRFMMYAGMIGFLLASFGAGLSGTIWLLLLFRFFQGAFTAILVPSSFALISEVFPKEQRGLALGINGAIFGIGMGFGPAIGGILVTIAGWPWLFFVNIPTIVVAFLICLPFIRESKNEQRDDIDWLGVLFFVLGFGGLIVGLTEAPIYGWGSIPVLCAFAVAVVFFPLFLLNEKKTRSPLLPLHLFKNRGFLLGSSAYILTISCVYPILFLSALYLQNVLDFSPLQAGLTLLAMTIMTVVAPLIAGIILDKKGAFLILSMLFVIILTSYLLQLFFTPQGPLPLIIAAFVCFGFGWGAGNGIGTPLALSELPSNENAGLVSGSVVALLNFFGVLLLALTTLLFQYSEKGFLQHLLNEKGITLTPEQSHLQRAFLSDPEQLKALEKGLDSSTINQIVPLFRESFLFGYKMAILSLIVFAILVFVGIWRTLGAQRRT